MSLLKALNTKKIEAMKSKDTVMRDAMIMVLSTATNLAKAELVEINDTHAMAALKREIKQTNDTIKITKEALEKQGKDLTVLDKEYTKLELLNSFLPKQLTEEEVLNEVESAILTLSVEKNMKSMGVVMKHLQSKLGDTVDSSMLSKVVKQSLSN